MYTPRLNKAISTLAVDWSVRMKFRLADPLFESLEFPPRPNIKAAKIADFPLPLAPLKYKSKFV